MAAVGAAAALDPARRPAVLLRSVPPAGRRHLLPAGRRPRRPVPAQVPWLAPVLVPVRVPWLVPVLVPVRVPWLVPVLVPVRVPWPVPVLVPARVPWPVPVLVPARVPWPVLVPVPAERPARGLGPRTVMCRTSWACRRPRRAPWAVQPPVHVPEGLSLRERPVAPPLPSCKAAARELGRQPARARVSTIGRGRLGPMLVRIAVTIWRTIGPTGPRTSSSGRRIGASGAMRSAIRSGTTIRGWPFGQIIPAGVPCA